MSNIKALCVAGILACSGLCITAYGTTAPETTLKLENAACSYGNACTMPQNQLSYEISMKSTRTNGEDGGGGHAASLPAYPGNMMILDLKQAVITTEIFNADKKKVADCTITLTKQYEGKHFYYTWENNSKNKLYCGAITKKVDAATNTVTVYFPWSTGTTANPVS